MVTMATKGEISNAPISKIFPGACPNIMPSCMPIRQHKILRRPLPEFNLKCCERRQLHASTRQVCSSWNGSGTLWLLCEVRTISVLMLSMRQRTKSALKGCRKGRTPYERSTSWESCNCRNHCRCEQQFRTHNGQVLTYSQM